MRFKQKNALKLTKTFSKKLNTVIKSKVKPNEAKLSEKCAIINLKN